MKLNLNLGKLWSENLVEGDRIKTRNRSGDKEIEIGIENTNNSPTYYANVNYSTGESQGLEGKVSERFINGTDFVIQLNKFRGYKPVTSKPSSNEGEREAPKSGSENCAFGCNNKKNTLSLLNRDSSGQIVLNHGRFNLYYNAFPIEEEGHFMFVPVEREESIERIPHVSQRLNRESVKDFLDLSRESEDAIFFFNSIHGGASVDHFHVQLVCYRRYLKNGEMLKNGKYAIENASVDRQNGRDFLKDYPITGLRFNFGDKTVWDNIEKLQNNDVPFNWILVEDRNYLVPRKKEYEKVSEFPNILASLEITGKIVTTDEKTYSETNIGKLYSAFDKLSYSISEIKSFLD
jgi:hypothetical protein